eukprot:13485629-Ditylum_brightwellii.AAC.1
MNPAVDTRATAHHHNNTAHCEERLIQIPRHWKEKKKKKNDKFKKRRGLGNCQPFPPLLAVYQSLMILLRGHLLDCPYMPNEEKEVYAMLRSNASQGIVGSKS